jgi:lysophospholipase L1-like esterase
MKTPLVALFFLVSLSVRAQTAATSPATPAPAPTAAASSTPAPSPTPPVTAAAPVYPTNATTILTDKAGILGLRGIDIPRYTQTGPLPANAPDRHGVLAPFPHDPTLPTIWTIGDSTVRTGVNGVGEDKVGQWGWGTPFVGYFDPKKVNVVNRAVGGTTSRSFYLAQWKALVGLIKKGDVVILQFGTNSGGGELRGIGEDTQTGTARDGTAIVNHTFGWYLRQFIAETRAKGATPIVCSLIPRDRRDAQGKTVRDAASQAGWAKDVAAAEGVGFIDLNELVSRKYDLLDKNAVDLLFSGSPHTSWTGAVINAETVISGLKALKPDPVAAYYVDAVKQIAPAPDLTAPSAAPAPAAPAAPATPGGTDKAAAASDKN